MNDNELPEEIKNTLADLSDKIYDDVAAPPLKQVGLALEGLFKFIALPFKCLGVVTDKQEERFLRFIHRSTVKIEHELVISEEQINLEKQVILETVAEKQDVSKIITEPKKKNITDIKESKEQNTSEINMKPTENKVIEPERHSIFEYEKLFEQDMTDVFSKQLNKDKQMDSNAFVMQEEFFFKHTTKTTKENDHKCTDNSCEELVRKFNITSIYKGYYLLIDAIKIMKQNSDKDFNRVKDIYAVLSHKHNLPVFKVERYIRIMIIKCWNNNPEYLNLINGNNLDHVPTNFEFIEMASYWLSENAS